MDVIDSDDQRNPRAEANLYSASARENMQYSSRARSKARRKKAA